MSGAEELYRRVPPWAQTALLNLYALRVRQHRYGRRYRERVAELLESERWSKERMRRYQDERLEQIVRLAYERSPFYRERFERAGVQPGDIRGTADLSKLPLLTREDLREHGERLQTSPSQARGWLHGHTSGTTGSPLGLWYDREFCALNNAVDARQKSWGGMREGNWIGLFLGRVVVPTHQARGPFWRANHVLRQVWFSSFHLSPANLPAYIEEIGRRGLRFFEGYPSTLYILANYLRRRGETLPLHAVYSSSETLHEVQRSTIEEAFQCRLFDFYGLAERVIFASECEAHSGKHLAEEFGFTEVVDEAGRPVPDGEVGYLVGTSLHNTAMPMLRYRTSDVSRVESANCPCGRSSRRISDVATKAEDIIATPDGRMISPSILTHPFKPFDQIVKSQIIQEEIDRVRVRIVPSAGFTRTEQEALLAGLRERLGETMKIELELTEDIPREVSGKFRWVVSRVDHSNLVEWESSVGRG
jgi:phenylacetate-CoA ligase